MTLSDLEAATDLLRRGEPVPGLDTYTKGQRSLLGARALIQRDPRDTYEAVISQLSKTLRVGTSSIDIARRVAVHGEPTLVGLLWEGYLTTTTAERVARSMSAEDQRAYVEKVREGFDPKRLAPPSLQDSRRGVVRKSERATNRGAQHRAMLDNMVRTLGVWSEHTLEDIAELDDSVGPEAAGDLARDLTRALRTLARINRLLRDRQHGTSSR